MIQVNEVLQAGYREYPSGDPYCRLFQKTITQVLPGPNGPGGKKLYFINFKLWDISKLDPRFTPRWEVEVRLFSYVALQGPESFDKLNHINLVLMEVNGTVADVERFYNDAYQRLYCVPDIHNND